MILYRIECLINLTAKIKIAEYLIVKETDKQFKIENKSINKSKLLLVESILKNDIQNDRPTISYYTYCLESDIDKAKELVYNKASNRITELHNGIKNLVNSISDLDY